MKRRTTFVVGTLVLCTAFFAGIFGGTTMPTANADVHDCWNGTTCPYHATCTGDLYEVVSSCKWQCKNYAAGSQVTSAGTATCSSGTSSGGGSTPPPSGGGGGTIGGYPSCGWGNIYQYYYCV
jgi:hypothetical protein